MTESQRRIYSNAENIIIHPPRVVFPKVYVPNNYQVFQFGGSIKYLDVGGT